MNIICKCGVEFRVKPSHHWRKYCSRPCGYKYRDTTALKGRKIVYTKPNPSWFRPGENLGEKHHLWKGDKASYRAIHIWINAHKEKAGYCSSCLSECKTDWANISGDYIRKLYDWEELCRKCHKSKDVVNPGIIQRRFS